LFLLKHIDKIEQQVLSARPLPNDPDYEEKRQAYCEMIKVILELIKKLQDTCDNIFSQYFEFFDLLWDAIKQGKDSKTMIKQFTSKIEKETQERWKPFFEILDDVIHKMNNTTPDNQQLKSRNQNIFKTITSWLP
jgi:CRISPR/Cas system CSM-associated protein Csm2 small subunit